MAGEKRMKDLYTIYKMGKGYMHYLELSPAQVKKLTIDGNKRVICTLAGTIRLHAAVMKTKEGMYYVMIGSKYLRQLQLSVGNQVKATFIIDKSELQFPMPEELAEVLRTDPDAELVFNRLTPGNKRGLMALVNMVKSMDKRIERALLIAEKIKKGVHSPQMVMKK
jgi:Bacteriocin-protection, YdeI or OmpD-Associated